MNRLRLILALTLGVASCAGPRQGIELNPRAMEPGRLMQLVAEQRNRLATLVAKGTVTFEGSELAGAATFSLALRRPDSLLVRFEGPFGMTLGTVFLSHERFVVYSSIDNTVLTGAPSSEGIAKVLPIPLTAEQVVDAFCGAATIIDEPASLTDYAVEGNRFRLTFHSGGVTHRYWIDPDDLLVTRAERLNEQGEIVLEMTVSRVVRADGIPLPRRISVRMPLKDRSLSIAYSSVTLNTPAPSFRFTVPGSARRSSP